jgi:hypothetical protein
MVRLQHVGAFHLNSQFLRKTYVTLGPRSGLRLRAEAASGRSDRPHAAS